MRAEIINVGDEMLRGEIYDENTSFLAREVLKLGLEISKVVFVKDAEEEIVDEIQRALTSSELVIVSGGLGPTPDDLTRKSIAKALEIPLEIKSEIKKEIEKRMKHFKAPPELIEEQSRLPKGARPIFSKRGSAPGFTLTVDKRIILALPGVPQELREIMVKTLPILKTILKPKTQIFLEELRVCEMCEAEIIRKLSNKEVAIDQLAFYPGAEEVRVVVKGPDPQRVKETAEKISELLGENVYRKSLPEEVGDLLKKNLLSLSVAESCTGGWLGKAITSVPGSSAYFLGGVIAYSNRAKEEILQVPPEVLKIQGAVSAECALFMAQGVRKLFGSSISLAVTGIAGPAGGSRDKPVGLVFIGLSSPQGDIVEKYQFPGEREEVRKRSVRKSLNLLRRFLLKSQEGVK